MRTIKTVIGSMLILIGISLVSIPFYYEWKQEKEVKALEEALSLLASADDSVDLSSIDNLPFNEEQLKGVLELEIPSIELKQKILMETTEENLSVSLTQIKSDQTPGEGNFTIAGHRGYRGDRHFRNLPEVPVGEEVFLHAGDQTFVYKVTSSEVIDPTYVEILEDTEDKVEITLITCTVGGKDRIALKGELIETIN